jgi:hypothetical protein
MERAVQASRLAAARTPSFSTIPGVIGRFAAIAAVMALRHLAFLPAFELPVRCIV